MWFFLSLLCAYLTATTDALSKKALEEENIYYIAWIRLVFCFPFLAIILLLNEIPAVDRYYFIAVFCGLPLEIIALLCYMKAIQISDLSLTIPFLALTPVFLIPTSYLMLGEKTGLKGMIGIAFITIGGYILNIQREKNGFLTPFKMMAKEKGILLMIAVAFIYSITSNFGKMGITHSSPVFFGCTYFMIQPFLLLPFIKKSDMKISSLLKRKKWLLLLIGVVYALSLITHFAALSLTNVAYMIAVKRSNLIFSVLYGYFFFNEKGIGQRISGALLMLAGIIILAFQK
ncbi:MAG: EamA family transporter [Candidatus Schekmanbacteria bacterium]|nr:MAG: EamA family transporter [Candidatus Schekmanbacteria bacterium]